MNNKLSWDSVTLGKYLEIEKVLKNDGTTLDKALDFLYILTGKDYSKVPLEEYMAKVSELSFLNTDVPTINLPKEIEINGKKYLLRNDVDKITTAQFIDYTNYAKSEDADKIIKIVATFIIPKGCTYGDGYDFKDVIKDAAEIPLPIANSIAFFLQSQSKKYIKRSLHSLAFQIMTNPKVTLKKKIKAVEGLVAVWHNLEYFRTFCAW